MSQGKEHIDKLLQEKLLAAEVTPPASVWDSIESSLVKKQRKAAIVLYRWLGSAAAILLLGFLAFYFTRSDRSLEPTENRLTQKVIIDTAATDKDSSSTKKSVIRHENISRVFEENLPSIAVVEKEIPRQTQKQQVSIAQHELPVDSGTRENSYLVSLNTISQGELESLYELNENPLIAIKANFLKMILASDNLIIQLAELTDKSGRKGWSIGLAYAPTNVARSSGIFTPKTESFYDAANSEMSFMSEKDLPAYSGGVNIEYQLSDRLSFQSGIYYLKQGQRIENFSVVENSMPEYYQLSASYVNSNSYFGNIVFDNFNVLSENADLANSTEWTSGISYIEYNNDLLQQFELIEIPFVANYKIINRKAIFSLIAGINSGILVGNRVYLSDYTSDPVGKTEAINTMIYKSVFGVSFEYPLSRKLYFNLSPTFKYQLNNFNKNAIVNEQLKYLEFKTGLNYRF